MIYEHYSLAPWDFSRWPNFKPSEPGLSCPCCGEFFLDHLAMDCLQKVRDLLKRPVHLNSGHRCPIHNAKVGGAPLSQHKLRIAFDISLANQHPVALLSAAKQSGFKGFGFYQTFLHVDLGRSRRWITTGGKKTWNGLV